jgi:hypothetical protein
MYLGLLNSCMCHNVEVLVVAAGTAAVTITAFILRGSTNVHCEVCKCAGALILLLSTLSNNIQQCKAAKYTTAHTELMM